MRGASIAADLVPHVLTPGLILPGKMPSTATPRQLLSHPQADLSASDLSRTEGQIARRQYPAPAIGGGHSGSHGLLQYISIRAVGQVRTTFRRQVLPLVVSSVHLDQFQQIIPWVEFEFDLGDAPKAKGVQETQAELGDRGCGQAFAEAAGAKQARVLPQFPASELSQWFALAIQVGTVRIQPIGSAGDHFLHHHLIAVRHSTAIVLNGLGWVVTQSL
jgi:hypothetical protein